jgi:tripartite-type tricarboxylate transporter receptor subunit TctC
LRLAASLAASENTPGIRMRLILLFACLATFALPLDHAAAGDYPSRPVHVITPFSAGGAPDVLMRVVAQKLSESWGEAVIVENRPGGNTLIGTVAVTKSEPDGYTLLLAADQTFILNPLLYANLPYAMKDLEPIILMASVPHMLAVANKVPVTNVKELIALAKAKPETLLYGSTGPGSVQRLATEYFAGIVGVKLVHVPYKGANETTAAILAGEIDMTINGMSNILPHIASGRLKALAISTATRNPLAPDVPTMQEAGVPGYTSQGTFGLLAPAGIPIAIKEKIARDVAEVLSRPDVRTALQAHSFVVQSDTTNFDTVIKDETAKWGDVVKRLNIQLE